MKPELSVVVPIFSEEENIRDLFDRLVETLDRNHANFELIFINDCSLDGSLEIMRDLHKHDPRVKIISLSRNFGHQIAITAGLNHARGSWVVVMDGDLQDPPEMIPKLIEKRDEENWDIVYAIRRKRQEGLFIRLLYHLFYRMLRRTSYIDIPTDAGDFCLMSRRVVDQLNRLPERNRFIRGLRSWIGFRQVGVEYDRAARGAGSPKYTFRSLFKLAFDGIFSFSFVPLRISTYLGLALSGAGLAYAAVVFARRFFFETYEQLEGWATVVVSVLVLGGVQLIILGIMGEYLGRIFEEIKGRPQYVVDETVGFDD